MIKVLASIVLAGMMAAGGTLTLPVLPEKILVDNPTIHTFYDNSNNFAITHNGNVNMINGQTGEVVKTWPVEGSIYKLKSDYCIFYNALPGNSRMYVAFPSANRLLSQNEHEEYLVLDGVGSYARLPSRNAKGESNLMTVYPEGKPSYTIAFESTVFIGASMAGKYNDYLYYLQGDKQDENVLWLTICDFATGAQHFSIKSEPEVFKLSFSGDKVIFGKSVYDIPSKTKLFTVKEGLPEFFGNNYYTTTYDNRNITYTLLDPSGAAIKSRKADLMTRYRLTSIQGGFLVEQNKDYSMTLSDAFDENTPKITIAFKSGVKFQTYPLGTKLLAMYGSELLCFDYDTKKLSWKKDFQRISYKNSWSLPTIFEAGEDGKETLKVFDYKSEEYIPLPEGYANAIKGETVAWILPGTTKPEQPWPLVYKDGQTTPATGESSNGTVINAYAWKDILVVCIFVPKDDKTVTKSFYEYVRVKDGQKTMLFKTTDSMNYNAAYSQNHCTFGSKTLITDINIETLEKKETNLVKPSDGYLSYLPWQDGYLFRLKGSMGFVQNGKTVRTFKGSYVHHNDNNLWTSYNPGTTEVDDEGNTYTYTELVKYEANGAKADSVIFKNSQNTPIRLDDNLYYFGNTITDSKGSRLQTLLNMEKISITSGFIRFLSGSQYTSTTDYSSLSSNLVKWSPCATYTATMADGKLVIKNNSQATDKGISGEIMLAPVGTGDTSELAKFDGKTHKLENLMPGEEISFDVGQIQEGKKLVLIAEVNGMLDLGPDPSNDFKTNHDRFIGIPMSKKLGFARVVHILE